jgi:transcriptional regulator with GAF, ATPase, and Fis domain
MDEPTRKHLSHNRRTRDKLSEPTDSSPTQPNAAVAHRIDCVKVLALTLLREIESLENAEGNISDFDLTKETRHFESEMIRSALIKTGGRQRRAARLLGMKVTTLNTKIRRYGIKIDEKTVAE